MNTYFRITAYDRENDISFIIDSVNQYSAIWEFSADLVSKKCEILYVSKAQQFDSGNIALVNKTNDCYILRACMYGKVEAENGVVNIRGRYYTPNMGR